MKPTRMLTHSQAAEFFVLKEASPSFVVMRGLAMRFRSFLGGPASASSAFGSMMRVNSGIRALRQFARVLNRDINAVRNATAEQLSSGQAEDKSTD